MSTMSTPTVGVVGCRRPFIPGIAENFRKGDQSSSSSSTAPRARLRVFLRFLIDRRGPYNVHDTPRQHVQAFTACQFATKVHAVQGVEKDMATVSNRHITEILQPRGWRCPKSRTMLSCHLQNLSGAGLLYSRCPGVMLGKKMFTDLGFCSRICDSEVCKFGSMFDVLISS